MVAHPFLDHESLSAPLSAQVADTFLDFRELGKGVLQINNALKSVLAMALLA